MEAHDLVRAWKDPDGRGDTGHPAGGHPAGEIALDELYGGAREVLVTPTVNHCDTSLMEAFRQPL